MTLGYELMYSGAESALSSFTMRCNCGKQEPQLLPHFRALCKAASRAGALPMHWVSCASIATSVTLKQVHTTVPLLTTGIGGTLPGISSARP